jgi:hypothetical protein
MGLMILMGADKGMGVRLQGDVIDTSPVKDFFLEQDVRSIEEWYLREKDGKPFFENLLMNEIGPYLENKYPHLFVTEEPKTRLWSEIQAGYGGRGPRTEEEAVKFASKELDEIPDYLT